MAEQDRIQNVSSSRSRPGDRLADLVISAEPLDAPPTPPYRQYAASISDDIQSPPYRSRSQVHIEDPVDDKHGGSTEQDMGFVVEKRRPLEDHSRDNDNLTHDLTHDHDRSPAKGVHYTDSFPHTEKPVKFDSSHDLPDHAPSAVPSDNEDNVVHADDEDYDWSTDDDEADEEAKKFEAKADGSIKRNIFLRVTSFFFSTLVGSALSAAVLVGAALAVHFLYYKRGGGDEAHKRYVATNVEAWLFWAAANLLISWFLALIINIIPGIVTWAIFIVWGHISESMKTRVELYNSLRETVKPIFYAASGWLSWDIIFANIFELYNHDNADESWASYTPRVFQVIEFIFFFVTVLSLQSMLSQMIAFAFHKTAFKDRLTELEKALKTIETLKKYKPKHRSGRSSGLFGNFGPSLAPTFRPFGTRSAAQTPAEEKSHLFSSTFTSRVGSPNASRGGTPDLYDEGHSGDTEDNSPSSSNKGKGKARATQIKEESARQSPVESRPNSPAAGKLFTNTAHDHLYPPNATPSPRPSRRNTEMEEDNAVLQAGKVLKKAVLHDARNMTGKEDTEIAGLGWAIGSNEEARRLARSIYEAFKTDKRRKYLVVEDFYPAYRNHDAALEAFRVFDIDHNGDISKSEIKSALVKTYRERRFLSRSMRDVGQALRSLNRALLLFAFIIIFFVGLSVFGVDIDSSLTSFYTIGIAASFIFKTTAQQLFDSIMFLFVTHPFDTGDRCFIDTENLVVKKMGLLATVFIRADGTETYYFNSQLFTKFITNARRSDKTAENCTLYFSWKTPMEKIDELEKCINDWLSVEENRWYQPSTSIVLQAINNQNYLEVSIVIPHNSNWQDWGLRNQRRSTFYAAVTYYCRQLGITYAASPMPLVWAGMEEAMAQPEPSPTSASFNIPEDPMDGAASAITKDMKPMLGFLPPPERRDANLLRARKSKGGKKNAMRAAGS